MVDVVLTAKKYSFLLLNFRVKNSVLMESIFHKLPNNFLHLFKLDRSKFIELTSQWDTRLDGLPCNHQLVTNNDISVKGCHVPYFVIYNTAFLKELCFVSPRFSSSKHISYFQSFFIFIYLFIASIRWHAKYDGCLYIVSFKEW